MDSTIEPGATFDATKQTTLARVMQTIRELTTVSEVLRVAGALTVIASMSLFLLQGWNEGNDIHRYLLLLGQTFLLTAGGFALSYVIKENKGARIFFGLGLISVPVNFTILGALLYSFLQWDNALIDYPYFAAWVAGDAGSFLLAIGVATLVLLPTTLLAYSIVARRSAKPLAAMFLLANATLLLPVRDSSFIAPIAAATTMLVMMLMLRVTARDNTLRTAEGRFARAALFIPTSMMLIRSLYLYPLDDLLIFMLALTAFMILRQSSLLLAGESRLRVAMEWGSLPIAMLVAGEFVSMVSGGLGETFQLPLFGILAGAMIVDIAIRNQHDKQKATLRMLAGMLLCGSFVVNLIIFDNLLTANLCLIAGATAALYGYLLRQTMTLYLGLVTALVALGALIPYVIQWFDFDSWATLAAIGVTAIIVGSVVERHGAPIKFRIEKWQQSIKDKAA